MVQVDISDDTNQILGIVKTKFNLKDESAAIDFIVAQCEIDMLEPELKPEFIEEMQNIIAGKHIGPFKTVDDLKAYIEVCLMRKRMNCV